MFEVVLLIALVIVLTITLTTIWWNETLCHYNILIEDLKESLEESKNREAQYLDALDGIREIVMNDDTIYFRTKGGIFKILKSTLK